MNNGAVMYSQEEVDQLLSIHGIKPNRDDPKKKPEVTAIILEIKKTAALVAKLKDQRRHQTHWSLWDDNSVATQEARDYWTSLDNRLFHEFRLVYEAHNDKLFTIEEWLPGNISKSESSNG